MKASQELIEIFEETHKRLSDWDDSYEWGSVGTCNCGQIAKTILERKKQDLTIRENKEGEYTEQAEKEYTLREIERGIENSWWSDCWSAITSEDIHKWGEDIYACTETGINLRLIFSEFKEVGIGLEDIEDIEFLGLVSYDEYYDDWDSVKITKKMFLSWLTKQIDSMKKELKVN
jgi:hypothetical protein